MRECGALSAKNLWKALFITGIFLISWGSFLTPAEAATNIAAGSSAHWAWNDAIGWIDFYNTNTVIVTSTEMQGYASSSVGDISFDCATTRIGNICGASNYGITNNGTGDLSGYAWNDVVGWISFDCSNHGGCGSSSYQVYIDPEGDFRNYAWNDVIGWISVHCDNTGGCGISNYKVSSSWIGINYQDAVLDSITFDSGVVNGVQLMSVLWHGNQPPGTSVEFQFAASNASSGPWTFYGPGSSTSTTYVANEGAARALDFNAFANFRYFRYRVYLYSNSVGLVSPRIDDVVLKWSR